MSLLPPFVSIFQFNSPVKYSNVQLWIVPAVLKHPLFISEESLFPPTDRATLWPSCTARPSWNATIWSSESSSWATRWEEKEWCQSLVKLVRSSSLSVSSRLVFRRWTSTRTCTDDRWTMWSISWTLPSSPLTWLFISSQHNIFFILFYFFTFCLFHVYAVKIQNNKK